jgi:hypothetical protein
MSTLIMLVIGFVMNFLVGFGIRGFFFRELPPLPRAIYTALVSLCICVGAATFGGYYLIGLQVAVMAFATVMVLYALPAILHFLMLYYQFKMGWAVTDEDVIAEEAALKGIASRRVATVRSDQDDLQD